MKNMHLWQIDGRALALLIAIHDERSLSAAAPRLGVSPSAASHALDRLRHLLGDPLFVRHGRGITPTTHALAVIEEARDILRRLEGLGHSREFDPADATGTFVIAANDYQRDLVLPELMRQVRRELPKLDVRVLGSGFENADLLRRRDCDLMITPDPPGGTEFFCTRLLDDSFVCFYDPTQTKAPTTLEDYLARPHAKVVFSADEPSHIDRVLASSGKHRRFALIASGFNAIATLLPGTDIVTTLPSRLSQTSLAHLATAPCPIAGQNLTVYLAWHQRAANQPLNRFIRDRIRAIAGRMTEAPLAQRSS